MKKSAKKFCSLKNSLYLCAVEKIKMMLFNGTFS